MTTEILLDAPRGHYRPKHIARSELAKIVTLRSTAITVGLTVVACLLVTGLASHAATHHGPGYYQGFDPTQQSLSGMITVALAGGVFGALLITGEYSSGTIRSTLGAAPKRPMLLAVKLGVTTGLTMAFSVVLSFVSFFLGQAILSNGGAPTATLASPGAARAVVLTGLFIGLLALMAFGFGLDLPKHGCGDRRIRGGDIRPPPGHARHLRGSGPLSAEQHPDQLDHVDGDPGSGRALPATRSRS